MNGSQCIKSEKELEQLLQEFLRKKNDGFVFRGHASSTYELRPKFFRKEEVENSWKKYGLSREFIQKEWFENKKTLSELSCYLYGREILTKFNYQSVTIFHKKNPIPLARLLWSYIDLMKYNYIVSQYISNNQNYYVSEYLKSIQDRPPEYWKCYDTFLRLLQEALYIVDRRSIDSDKLINQPEIFEGMAAYDETRPQHYDIATTALDWTRNPHVALYFSVKNFVDSLNPSGIIGCPDVRIALFSFKQLKNHDDVSVKLQEADKKIMNDRIIKQDGVFTWMPKARSFYLLNGEWPSVEKSYNNLIGDEFFLEKYCIILSNSIIEYIQHELKIRNINKESLGLTEVIQGTYAV